MYNTPSALDMWPLTTAMPGQRKASELFKRSCTTYSCNAPKAEAISDLDQTSVCQISHFSEYRNTTE